MSQAIAQFPSNLTLLEQQKKSSRTFSWPVVMFILLLIFVVVAISFLFLSKQSLRLDEAQSLWQSSHSSIGTINVISHDVHLPLYGLILHFWLILNGTGVVDARILSLIFFIITIPCAYALAKISFNKNVAIFTSILVATSPFLNWYGNETRMYSLLTLIAVLNEYFFIKIFLNKSGQHQGSIWFAYILTSLFGIYTHYFFWLLLITEGIFFIMHSKSFPKKTFRYLCISALVLILAIIPWALYVFLQHGLKQTIPHLLPPGSVDLFNTFSQFMFGFQDDHINTIILSLWPLSVLLGFLSLRKKNNFPPISQFFFMTAILPIITAFCISIFFRPVFLARYLILATPGLYIFLSWFFSTFPPLLSKTIKLGFSALMIFTLIYQSVSANTPIKENYQQAAEYINKHSGPSDIVTLSAPFTLYPFDYYYRGQASVTTIPIWNPYSPQGIPDFTYNDLISEVDEIKKSHDKIWLLLSYDQGYENDIRQYFETHYQRLDHQTFSNGLDLYVYQLRY